MKKKILLAGATGYLGRYLVSELKAQNFEFLALARNLKILEQLGLSGNQMAAAEVTRPETLAGCFRGIDTVISTVGITRQKDGLTYMEVDYQANKNLLDLALENGVRKFIYISVLNGKQHRALKIMEAKEKFVDRLIQSGIEYTVIRPNGFFSDLRDFLQMAKKGTVYLFGNGNQKLNPIHGADLAKLVVDAINMSEKEIEVGGPDILTQNEIARLALETQSKPLNIVHLPDWTRRMVIGLLRTFTSSRTYGPYEFFLTLMAGDNIAPRYGIHRLETFFKEETDRIAVSQ